MNINEELFKRYRPQKKLEIINALTDQEVKAVTYSTLLRIVKEAGQGNPNKARSKFKTLYIGRNIGNDWNSTIDRMYNSKKDELYLDVYIQGDDIDTTDTCKVTHFINWRYDSIIAAEIHEEFRDGYSHTLVARYDEADRLRVLRAILKQYVYSKYHINE